MRIAVIVLLLVLVSIISSRLSAETGSIAPPNTWSTRGGCPSRTRATLTTPVRGDLVKSWSVDLSGDLVGEPLVWEDVILVETFIAEPKPVRQLTLLRLSDGKQIRRRSFKTSRPLHPTLWRKQILLRDRDRRLGLYEIQGKSLALRFSWSSGSRKSDPGFGPPLHDGEQVYAVVGDRLRCFVPGRKKAVWEASSLRRHRGTPSLRGNSVFVVAYDSQTNAHIEEFHRETGELLSHFPGFHHEGKVPGDDDDLELAILDSWLAVRSSLPLVRDKTPYDSFLLERKQGGDARATVAGAAGWHEGWLSLHVDTRTGGRNWFAILSTDPILDGAHLANEDVHADLLKIEVPPVRARNVGMIGALGVDLDTQRITFRVPGEIVCAPIPARNTLLLVRPGRVLEAWRQEVRVEKPYTISDPPKEKSPVTVITAAGDAKTTEATVRLRPSGVTVKGDREETEHELSDLLAVFQGQKIVATPGVDALLRGLRVIEDRDLGEAYVGLARAALEVKAIDLARGYLKSAELRGAPRKSVALVRNKIKPSRRTPKAEELTALERREHDARTAAADWRHGVLVSLPESAPRRISLALLRDLLRRFPTHEPSRQIVLSSLPKGLEPPAGFHALDWIDLLVALERTPFEVVLPERIPSTHGRSVLYGERRKGRRVLGFESKNLFIISPPVRPGAIARALALGELVYTALESMFADLPAQRPRKEKIVLILHPSKEDYLKHSRPHEEAGLAWTSGHYNPQEIASRFFIPDGDESLEAVRETLIHELTHHWLDRCCLALPEGGQKSNAGTAGFWLVEGFASMVEEFEFDPEEEEWSSTPRRSLRLDLVANARKSYRIAWPRLFRMSQLEFHNLRAGEGQTLPIPTSWQLGVQWQADEKHLFYAQAAAVCHYLYNAREGDRFPHRRKLLDCTVRYYSDQTGRFPVDKLLGLSVEELGAAAVRHARESQKLK